MIDLIVFNVASNRYAMNIENVQRIIQATALTNIPNAHPYIDGMMSYEGKVIKVLSFRKLINMQTYESELEKLFASLKVAHADWVRALRVSLEKGTPFAKTLDPHACGLGKWIDAFTAYDDTVVEILAELVEYHKRLHLTGGVALDMYKRDVTASQKILNEEIEEIYGHTMGALERFIQELDVVANSLQKFIIYDNNGAIFAIKVDGIEDIAHIEESSLISAESEHDVNDFLDLEGVLDLDGALINVIKTVRLPK